MNGGKELEGRVAIVTGAGRNIGKAIALTLAEGGAAVIVNARSNQADADGVVAAIEAAGGRAVAILADVADPSAVKTMMATANDRFGRIDFVVNNAAIRREKSFEQMTLADWREISAVILEGAFNCIKASLPALKRSGSASIVNIGGLSGHMGVAERAHVVAAKSGLVGLTRGLAREFAEHNITVNTVTPGLMANWGERETNKTPHPLYKPVVGRRGKPEEIAAMVRFLCGPQARYITGQNMQVNGGAFFG
jgi:3-oxoacyl-[acyl-carrier protein] reductase